jgi:hypothetical protein
MGVLFHWGQRAYFSVFIPPPAVWTETSAQHIFFFFLILQPPSSSSSEEKFSATPQEWKESLFVDPYLEWKSLKWQARFHSLWQQHPSYVSGGADLELQADSTICKHTSSLLPYRPWWYTKAGKMVPCRGLNTQATWIFMLSAYKYSYYHHFPASSLFLTWRVAARVFPEPSSSKIRTWHANPQS